MTNRSIKDKKAILFDSGRVLNGPTTGHWFITPNFFHFVNQDEWKQLSDAQIRIAFSKAHEYIDSQSLIVNREEEYMHFLEYYNILFQQLKELHIGADKIEALVKDYVYNSNKYTFFEDAKVIVPKLYDQYRLAVVSDAWPSLENIYIDAHLRDYFSSFVISTQLGVSKPNSLMYQKALQELGVQPHEAIFIDDNVINCEGAIKLGIDAVLLCRDKESYLTYKESGEISVISGLNELGEMLLK